MRKRRASQWVSASMRASSSQPGVYSRLQMDLESLYLLPSNHTLHFSGLKGSRAICDYAGINGTNEDRSSTALPLASAHMVLTPLSSTYSTGPEKVNGGAKLGSSACTACKYGV
jgi:hypothetical protein